MTAPDVPVPARRGNAGVEAGVGIVVVAVVTLFRRIHDAVAALLEAHVQANRSVGSAVGPIVTR